MYVKHNGRDRIRCFCNLPYHKPIASSKAGLPNNAIHFQHPLLSLILSCNFLRLLPRLPLTYNFPSICPAKTCFRRQFLHRIWSILLNFFLFVVRKIFLSFLIVCEKVKWSRYRPGVAQNVGRGIAVLFHDRSTRRGWVVSFTPRPHFTPVKDPVPILP